MNPQTGQTALSIAQKLGYISVVETLKVSFDFDGQSIADERWLMPLWCKRYSWDCWSYTWESEKAFWCPKYVSPVVSFFSQVSLAVLLNVCCIGCWLHKPIILFLPTMSWWRQFWSLLDLKTTVEGGDGHSGYDNNNNYSGREIQGWNNVKTLIFVHQLNTVASLI